MATSEQTLTSKQVETLCINTIRTLAMDAVQQANSGHPGAPMALAPVMYCLWQNFLRYDPADPVWPNRDRFVLSNGHASMLLYATLYLAQVRGINPEYERLGDYAITLDDIKRFRQIDSRTPGHPEYRIAAGIETTTGPLGQGMGNSVGMAIAANWLAAHYNRPGFEIFRSEEHTSELQSQSNLVCRLLLEKKKRLIRTDLNSTPMHCRRSPDSYDRVRLTTHAQSNLITHSGPLMQYLTH